MELQIKNFIENYNFSTHDSKLISKEKHEIEYIKHSNFLVDVNKNFGIIFEDINISISTTLRLMGDNRSRKKLYFLLIFNEYTKIINNTVNNFQL